MSGRRIWVACARWRVAGGGLTAVAQGSARAAIRWIEACHDGRAALNRLPGALEAGGGGWPRAAREGCWAPSKAARGLISLDHGWGGASRQPHQHWRLWRAAGAGRAAGGAPWC